MERKATFVAIENDGQKRTIENWKKADILLLLEALRVKNQDLYVFHAGLCDKRLSANEPCRYSV